MAEQRGMAKGIEKGIEQAIFGIARNCLANGISPDIIAKSTGLPVKKIQSLAN